MLITNDVTLFIKTDDIITITATSGEVRVNGLLKINGNIVFAYQAKPESKFSLTGSYIVKSITAPEENKSIHWNFSAILIGALIGVLLITFLPKRFF